MLKKLWDFLRGEVEPLYGQEIAGQIWSAAKLAEERHTGQMRLDGEPHLNHVLRVGMTAGEYALARQFEPERFRVLVLSGVLHDTLEDTATTDAELAAEFGPEVARTVRAVSHVEEEESEEVFLGRVEAGGELAILVKFFDRMDNFACLGKGVPPEFRAKVLRLQTAALPIWRRILPTELAARIEAELQRLREEGDDEPAS